MGYQYVLVIVHMVSRLVEAFLCPKADALTVAKKMCFPLGVYLPPFPVIKESTSLGKKYDAQIYHQQVKEHFPDPNSKDLGGHS